MAPWSRGPVVPWSRRLRRGFPSGQLYARTIIGVWVPGVPLSVFTAPLDGGTPHCNLSELQFALLCSARFCERHQRHTHKATHGSAHKRALVEAPAASPVLSISNISNRYFQASRFQLPLRCSEYQTTETAKAALKFLDSRSRLVPFLSTLFTHELGICGGVKSRGHTPCPGADTPSRTVSGIREYSRDVMHARVRVRGSDDQIK